jgi:hypothetical protein
MQPPSGILEVMSLVPAVKRNARVKLKRMLIFMVRFRRMMNGPSKIKSTDQIT